jgi:hypothetical protein
MRIDFYGIVLETPQVTFYLWSPWRAGALEHRLFDTVRRLPGVKLEQNPDEVRAHITDAKTWKAALQAICRILKGWQEEATDAGRERRAWRWFLEGDTDDSGYDYQGEAASVWAFLRVLLERGDPGEIDKNEEVELSGFGVRIWPNRGD